MADDQIILDSLLKEALIEIETVFPGEIFIVNDLFKNIRWKRLSHNLRLQLGNKFCRKILKDYPNIEPIEKDKSQKYKIIY